MNDVLYEAHSWLADDPDPVTRAELSALLKAATDGDSDAMADLGDRFAGFLSFGTAGLRGALGAGPNRMNRSVVIRAAAGLSEYLRSMREPVHGERHRVVVGYDARHGSRTFALDTAAVLTAAGVEVLLLPRELPTPVLAFALRRLDADAGVMVTASHNPPQDNGYKVYLGGPDAGAQIVAPIDAEIASYIHDVHYTSRVPRAEDGWTVIGEDVVDAYIDAAARVATPGSGPGRAASAQPDSPRSGSGRVVSDRQESVADERIAALRERIDAARERLAQLGSPARNLRIVLTSLHGVGGSTCVEALARAGFTDVRPVPEQAEPDPDFPTVAFPNPEEPGAIDLALTLGTQAGADVVLANDPDADRLAVAIPGTTPATDPSPSPASTSAGSPWRMLHGDEVGALLGAHLAGKTGSGVFVNSIVSSRLLGRIAAAHGIDHVETLTGFKWISRVPGLTYGYEEALGYVVDPESVRDKDGISAAVLFAELAAETKAAGRTLGDVLDDLARQHGLHVTDQLSVRVGDVRLITDAMRRLRRHPPAEFGGAAVAAAQDLHTGAYGLPPTDGLRYYLDNGSRVIIRPSGTEPKLKCYLEAVEDVVNDDVDAARSVARQRLAALRDGISAVLAL
ncbi:phospho-sugar mutase [Phytoactinopolyspora alkaliphila]|uniref:Phospho-sugar mutase n=1 Tax=Phytoactinopolyspora alkaliphila TaxID=1783498 RepID=A0A6N9YJN9_9ACTN|nr:phospho-sugar mutase [Phytoactinopolyspora alkaliphila]NED95167.1 phospho-sugar mutase [Phytoactinopolyspora alkaliphila]